MKNILRPFEGVDNISFGLKRNKLRTIIEGEYRVIKRNEYADNSSDYYEELGFFIEYSKDDICEAIEYTNTSSLYYNGINLFALKFSELQNKYQSLSSSIELEDEVGVTYHDLGFGVSFEFGTDNIESIIVFSNDYW